MRHRPFVWMVLACASAVAAGCNDLLGNSDRDMADASWPSFPPDSPDGGPVGALGADGTDSGAGETGHDAQEGADAADEIYRLWAGCFYGEGA